jgi:hypothetical protein
MPATENLHMSRHSNPAPQRLQLRFKFDPTPRNGRRRSAQAVFRASLAPLQRSEPAPEGSADADGSHLADVADLVLRRAAIRAAAEPP